jgi:hypothetical protein
MLRSAILLGYLFTISPLHAQNYPYCAQYDDGSEDCSFSSLSMCNQSVTGVGGTCGLNPRVSGSSAASAGPPSFNPAYVPPPPIQQLASGPVVLPSAQQQCNPAIDGTYCATAGAAPPPLAPIQSLSGDLAVGSDPPATLGAITFNSNGTNCIALFRRMSCGGP